MKHIDFQNYYPFEKYDTDNKNFDKYVGKTAADFLNHVHDDNYYWSRESPSKDIFIGNPKTQYINLWVNLASGTENMITEEDEQIEQKLYSLAFSDIVDDTLLHDHKESKEQVEKTLDNILTDRGSKYISKLNKFKSGEFVNLFNIENENLEKDTIYSYQLEDGDVYVFNTDSTPHIGITRDEFRDGQKGFRLSSETRLAILEMDINITELLQIEGTEIYINQDIARQLPEVGVYFMQQYHR